MKCIALLLLVGVAGAAAQGTTKQTLIEAVKNNPKLSMLASSIESVRAVTAGWPGDVAAAGVPGTPSCRALLPTEAAAAANCGLCCPAYCPPTALAPVLPRALQSPEIVEALGDFSGTVFAPNDDVGAAAAGHPTTPCLPGHMRCTARPRCHD